MLLWATSLPGKAEKSIGVIPADRSTRLFLWMFSSVLANPCRKGRAISHVTCQWLWESWCYLSLLQPRYLAGSVCQTELQHCRLAPKGELPPRPHLCAGATPGTVKGILTPEVPLWLAGNWKQNCDPFQAKIASVLMPSSYAPVVPPCWCWFDHSLDSLVMSLSDSKNFAEIPFFLSFLSSCCHWHFLFSQSALAWITHASNPWANSGIIKENLIYLNRGVRF